MAVENFTTFTEQDEDGAVTVAAAKCSWVDARTRYQNYWIYKDYGVGHFGNYTHQFTIYLSKHDWQSNAMFWMVANAIGDAKDLETDNDDQYFEIYGGGAGSQDEFYWYNESNNASDAYIVLDQGELGIIYYITVSRSGTTGTCLIYSNSGRTNLLDTLSITVSTTTFRYVYCFTGYNVATGNDGYSSGYTENLDLGEVQYGYIPGGGGMLGL